MGKITITIYTDNASFKESFELERQLEYLHLVALADGNLDQLDGLYDVNGNRCGRVWVTCPVCNDDDCLHDCMMP